MGAPIHTPAMRGATMHTFEGPGPSREAAPVRQWRVGRRGGMGYPQTRQSGWFAFRRTTGGVQIAYAGSHPADIPRGLWREWFGTAHDLELWNAARRELRITNRPPLESD